MIMKRHEGVFIIAEAGSNWKMGTYSKDLEMARCLIEVASECGADAIKFQTFAPEFVYAQGAGTPKYLQDKGSPPIEKVFKDHAMPYEMLPELAAYCKYQNIEFMSTPFSIRDAQEINPYVNTHKIASYEIGHLRLLEWIAKTGKPLILSTGASSYEDIEWALNHFYESGGKEIALLQNTAKYPTDLSMLNLKVIPNMIDRYNIEVGLSDHSRDPIIAPVCAVALGATIVEKHFTLHNKLPGPDHVFAVTPSELKSMVSAIRSAERVLGTPIKNVQECEQELRRFATRSIQATKTTNKGEVLYEGINIDVLRPGNNSQGLHPKFITEVNGKKATRDIDIGEGIQSGDYTERG